MDMRILKEAGIGETGGFTVIRAASFPSLPWTFPVPVIVQQPETAKEAELLQKTLLLRYEAASEIFLWDCRREKGEYLQLSSLTQGADLGGYQVLLDPERIVLKKASPFTLQPLLDVMKALREEGGCPWDRAQTADTLRTYLIQEAYEVVDAIQNKDRENWKEELGDVLFQVVFQARIAEEAGLFTMQDIIDGITDKMIRRHPHVFGDLTAGEAAWLSSSWEERKIAEKNRKHLLSGLSRSLPSLLFACIMQRKVSSICRQPPMLWADVRSRLAHALDFLEKRREGGSLQEVEMHAGDILFQMVRLVSLLGVDPELALGRYNQRYAREFGALEDACRQEGKTAAHVSPDALQAMEKALLEKEQAGPCS